MIKQTLAAELLGKVTEALAAGPAQDLEKNLKATLSAWFARLDLVTREEFDVQTRVLARTREHLQALEERITRLEQGDAARDHVPAPTADAA